MISLKPKISSFLITFFFHNSDQRYENSGQKNIKIKRLIIVVRYEEESTYPLTKEKLEDDVERLTAALKTSHSKTNTMFGDMLAYKSLSE